MTNGPAEIHSLVSNRTKQILLGISAVGTLAFVYAAGTGESTRAWQALLVNFLFFSGLGSLLDFQYFMIEKSTHMKK